MGTPNVESAIFIIPRSSSSWKGAEAIWVTIGGWALATEKILGEAFVVTKDRWAKPREVLSYPLQNDKKVSSRGRTRTLFPTFLRIFLKDLLLLAQSRAMKLRKEVLAKGNVRFIWEQHDLFPGPGKGISLKYGIPLVKYVHAPVVWEASKWGVKRYFWGRILEKLEARALRKADVVLVVSREVREKLLKMGVEGSKILISPMGVDPDLFSTQTTKTSGLKARYNLENKFIIGWTGSFRKFHGINHMIRAFAELEKINAEIRLILVGDGTERKDAENLARDLGIQEKVIFTGQINYLDIPDIISIFDIALVSAKSAAGFHYSPLKLREYLAAGKPVVAPRAGEIEERFVDNVHVKLFNPGDIQDIANSIEALLSDKNKREELASNGKEEVLKTGTWEAEVNKLLNHLQK